jgi:hypothetical protein
MATRALELTLISAKDLKEVNLLSKMEVYAVVSLSGDPRLRQQVQPDRAGGRNLTWNATLRFTVPAGGAGSLHVLLRAERALGDRDVGEVHIPLSELLSGAPDGPVPAKFVAYQVRKISSGKPQGVLNLSYKLGEVTTQSAAGYGPTPTPARSSYTAAAYPPTGKADAPATAYPPPSGYPPASAKPAKAGEPATAYPPSSAYPPASGKPSKAGEPAYPAAGPSTAAPYAAPQPQYGAASLAAVASCSGASRGPHGRGQLHQHAGCSSARRSSARSPLPDSTKSLLRPPVLSSLFVCSHALPVFEEMLQCAGGR